MTDTLFLNRELSWLSFNERVLAEAVDPTNPLLEQLRFIAITGSNLDEFFMIRVAGLMHLREGGVTRRDNAGMTPSEQLSAIAARCRVLYRRQYEILSTILTRLKEEGIVLVEQFADLHEKEQQWLTKEFERMIYPVVTPLAVDASHPFPFLMSRTLNLAVRLTRGSDEPTRLAILPVPGVLPRFLEIPSHVNPTDQRRWILCEEVLRHWANRFFEGYDIIETKTFRVTRNADLDIDEERTEDLPAEVEKSLKLRRKGAAVRLEIESDASATLRELMCQALRLNPDDVYDITGVPDVTAFFAFCDMAAVPHLVYRPHRPATPQSIIETPGEDLFAKIRQRDLFVHLPYESFDPVVALVAQAAVDPNVLAIKQTLYRVSSDSPIIRALGEAAENGKQVTVVMEVKARFDEENNIVMGRRLEEAGAHVIYGLVGVKTHSKCTLVIRKEPDGIRRYVHVGTGNYNAKTAKLYTDVGLFTVNDQFGSDASSFFNLLSGYSDPPEWNKFIVAPMDLRSRSLALIRREIEHARRGERAFIQAKMNSLLDREIIETLYEASQAGVEIDLIVRGICVLRPGIPGVSERIRVRSIVGRFLEHSRIFRFHHQGRDELFISSADWMPRNLNDRVELMVPVEEPRHKERLCEILRLELADNQKAHLMHADGEYTKTQATTDPINSQQLFLEMAARGGEQPAMTLRQRLEPYYSSQMTETSI